jgi:hypothetical protein
LALVFWELETLHQKAQSIFIIFHSKLIKKIPENSQICGEKFNLNHNKVGHECVKVECKL